MAACSCLSTSRRVAGQTPSQAGKIITHILVMSAGRQVCLFPRGWRNRTWWWRPFGRVSVNKRGKQNFFVFLQFNPTPKLPGKRERASSATPRGIFFLCVVGRGLNH